MPLFLNWRKSTALDQVLDLAILAQKFFCLVWYGLMTTKFNGDPGLLSTLAMQNNCSTGNFHFSS